MSDNDIKTERKEGYNPGIQKAKEIVNRGLACGFIAPEFCDNENGSDWEDYFNNRRQDIYTFENNRVKLKNQIIKLSERKI